MKGKQPANVLIDNVSARHTYISNNLLPEESLYIEDSSQFVC